MRIRELSAVKTAGTAIPHIEPPPVVSECESRGYLGKLALVLLFSWAAFGMKAMMTVSLLVGIPTRILTIPSHFATVGLSGLSILIVLLAIRPGQMPLRWAVLPFLAFWTMYCFRIFVEYLQMGMPGSPEPDAIYSVGYVAQRAIGSILLPSTAILLNLHWGFHRQARTLCLILTSVTAVAFVIMFRDNLLNFEHRMQAGDESGDYTTVSALHLGYAGLSLSAFLLYQFFSGEPKRLFIRVATLAAAGIALILIVGSASRGPVLALGCMVVPFAVSLLVRGKRAQFFALAGGCLAIAVAAISIADATGSTVFTRLISLQSDIEQQTAQSDRLSYYSEALETFRESPIAGVQTTLAGRAYPHNLFIESLMATGLLGTIPLCVLIGYALKCSWDILVRCPELGWIALNFYAWLCGAMFSGAIFTNAALWICLAATISARQWVLASQEVESRESRMAEPA